MNSRRGANEYSQTAYFIWNLLWLQVGMLLYGDYLLEEVKLGPLELNYAQSSRCFVALMGVFAFIGILSAWNNRTAFQVAANVLLPMEIYTAVSCLERWHPAVPASGWSGRRKKWREEFLDYEDGSSGTEEDDAAYRRQACEIDAGEGAEREMEKYMVYLK